MNRTRIREDNLAKYQRMNNYTVITQQQFDLNNRLQTAISNSTLSLKNFNDIYNRLSKKIQFLKYTSKESSFLTNVTKIYMDVRLKKAEDIVQSYGSFLNISQQPTSFQNYPNFEDMLNGQNSTLGNSTFSIKTSTQFFTSWNLNNNISREFSHMCAGDYFGVYLDPSTGILTSYGYGVLGRTNYNAFDYSPRPVELQLSTDEIIKQHACGSEHVLVLTSKAIYAWGSNTFGQLGDGTINSQYFPKQILTHDNSILYITAGPFNSAYVDKYGFTYIWGRGLEGQIGNGLAVNQPIPTLVSMTLGFSKLAFGNQHVIGRSLNGVYYYWGQRMADTDRVAIPSATTYFDHATNKTLTLTIKSPTQISSLLNSKLLPFIYSWGSNEYGQLGDGTLTSRSTPVKAQYNEIGNERKIVRFTHRLQFTYGITDDRRIVSWGRNDPAVCQTAAGGSAYVASVKGWSCNLISVPLYTNFAAYTSIENPLEVHLWKEGAVVYYSNERKLGLLMSGKFEGYTFSQSYIGANNFLSIVHEFTDIWLVSSFEKRFPVFENQTHKVIHSEFSFLTLTPASTESVVINKKSVGSVAKIESPMNFGGISFYNTHDMVFAENNFYFGGFLDNNVTDRIISKTNASSLIVYNQTLPYPVASGMFIMIDEYVYIFGGLTLDRGEIIPTNKVMRAHLSDLLIWTELKQTLPVAIYNAAITKVGEYLHLVGGRMFPLNSQYGDVFSAPISTLVWTNSNRTMPYYISETSIVSDDSNLYLFGGFSIQYGLVNSVLRARKEDPSTWEDLNIIPSNFIVGNMYTYNHNNQLYIFSSNPLSYCNGGKSVIYSITSFNITH